MPTGDAAPTGHAASAPTGPSSPRGRLFLGGIGAAVRATEQNEAGITWLRDCRGDPYMGCGKTPHRLKEHPRGPFYHLVAANRLRNARTGYYSQPVLSYLGPTENRSGRAATAHHGGG